MNVCRIIWSRHPVASQPRILLTRHAGPVGVARIRVELPRIWMESPGSEPREKADSGPIVKKNQIQTRPSKKTS